MMRALLISISGAWMRSRCVPSTPAFVAATAARHAVVPVGYRNRFGHPKEEVLARYAAAGMTVWRTDRDGAVELVLARDGVKARAWRSERPRYWHGR